MEKIVADSTEDVIKWSIDRINYLISEDTEQSKLCAMSMIKEYEEWIDCIENEVEIEYLSIKDENNRGWTDEQEIDVKE